MFKFLYILIALFLLFSPTLIEAKESFEINSSKDALINDRRVAILKAYLEKQNSPLAINSVDFVEAADKYELDWRLVAAISGVESTFGKFMPGGTDPKYTSYNGWGWGVYGTQAIYFKSFRDGIFTVSEGLRKNYLNRGLNDPYAINRIYAASPTWGSKVSFFLDDIQKFKDKYDRENPVLQAPNLNLTTAGSSARIITP